ncbi:Proteasome subunit beta type [Pyrenophora seminiperda CCB06]|uniref:Proteasome subunit beta type n=1 Tax=Pyrenophora seminiperda CCB06 TaxID=1302712 RepID=A0A3M7MAT9_9PLEO|nr:Proteasome subunit beta type [Pyrenophora seminiperda CCB06]
MATGGVVYKDLFPIPDTDPTVHEGKTTTLTDAPTDSHALALNAARTAPPEEKGAAQIAHENEVVDLGWNEPKELVAKPLVGGLGNEDLWLLVRRFNKQMYHVKEIPTAPPGGLDMNIADEEEFSPDKLRANIERLYMTIGIGLMGFGKHIVRVRSWRETQRTAWFCSAYFAAWLLDMIMPLLSVTLVTLIVYPPARETMFPPAPMALVSSTGGVQKPKSGTLGSTDSATGAPENHKGEAVEQEASNFVNGFASIALSSATGKHPQGEPPDEDSPDSNVPDPTRLAIGAADAKDQASGVKPTKDYDKTKVPMETAMWTKMRPIMHGLAEVTDTWERFAKFHFRVAAVVAPLVLVSLFTSSYMFMKGVTFGVGFGFFGDPIIQRGLELLNRKYPNWQKLLELRNTLLKGVPTNAQLTITLLRIGEANKAPLPPPPHVAEPPPEKPVDINEDELRATGADWPLNTTQEELDAAMAHDPTTAHETGGEDIDKAKDSKHGKKGSKILNFFRGTVKGGVETTITADKVKAAAGSTHAKNRLGAVPPRGVDLTSGPVEFKARFDGKKGHVYITTKATIPSIAFSTDKTIEKIGSVDREDLHPLWSLPVGDIMEMRKVGGFGWKARLVVGWAMGREVADGLVITDRRLNEYRITALPLRDELFNRLVAMGGQKWECW